MVDISGLKAAYSEAVLEKVVWDKYVELLDLSWRLGVDLQDLLKEFNEIDVKLTAEELEIVKPAKKEEVKQE